MHAEAAYYLQREDEARQKVNEVRRRARESSYCQGFTVGAPREFVYPDVTPKIPDLDSSITGQALLEAIWNERRLEFGKHTYIRLDSYGAFARSAEQSKRSISYRRHGTYQH